MATLLSLYILISEAHAQIANIEHVKDDPQLLSLQIPVWVPVEDGDKDAVEPYFDTAGRVVRLSSVSGVSFRLSPATALENFDKDDYAAALEAYPSVRDCLIESERSKPKPDLTRFDWTNMPNHGTAYACFVLIFTSYETAADVMWWMAAQGMFIQRGYGKYRLGGPAEHVSELKISKEYGLYLGGWFSDLPYETSKNPWPLSTFEKREYGVRPKFSKNTGLVSISITAHRMK